MPLKGAIQVPWGMWGAEHPARLCGTPHPVVACGLYKWSSTYLLGLFFFFSICKFDMFGSVFSLQDIFACCQFPGKSTSCKKGSGFGWLSSPQVRVITAAVWRGWGHILHLQQSKKVSPSHQPGQWGPSGVWIIWDHASSAGSCQEELPWYPAAFPRNPAQPGRSGQHLPSCWARRARWQTNPKPIPTATPYPPYPRPHIPQSRAGKG